MKRNLALDFTTARYQRLDACCRVGEEWGTSRMSDCLMNDVLISVRPDVVSDVHNLPYAVGRFKAIYFDPPHMIRNPSWSSKYKKFWRGFGYWRSRSEWESVLRAVDVEFDRVGAPGCRLYVKLLDGPDRRVTKRADLLLLSRWRVVSERREPPATPWSTAEVVFVEMLRQEA